MSTRRDGPPYPARVPAPPASFPRIDRLTDPPSPTPTFPSMTGRGGQGERSARQPRQGSPLEDHRPRVRRGVEGGAHRSHRVPRHRPSVSPKPRCPHPQIRTRSSQKNPRLIPAETLTAPSTPFEPTGTSPARYESRTPSPNASTTSGTTRGTHGASTSPSCTATCTPRRSTRPRTSCKTWSRW